LFPPFTLSSSSLQISAEVAAREVEAAREEAEAALNAWKFFVKVRPFEQL